MIKPSLIILAGGKGTRLGNLTKDIPKPMVDIHGKPFLYWLINYYHQQGFRDITISTNHLAEVIEEYPWPILVKFRRDDEVHGNEWAWKKSHAWIVNGDTWIDMPLPPVRCNGVILSHYDTDAGAQYTGLEKGYKQLICPCSSFYDIGTPGGLRRFKQYAADNLLCRE